MPAKKTNEKVKKAAKNKSAAKRKTAKVPAPDKKSVKKSKKTMAKIPGAIETPAIRKAEKAGTAPKGKYIYYFGDGEAEGNGNMKDLLGGKGAGLAEMTNTGVNVPPGFTITTDVCKLFYENNMEVPKEIEAEMQHYISLLEKSNRMGFGDKNNPLLVSVRSGAKFSMPGMMDTVLNLGLNDETLNGLIAKTENERFANDSYRRFIQMFGNVVLGIDKSEFEEILEKRKSKQRFSRYGVYGRRSQVYHKEVQGVDTRENGRGIPSEPDGTVGKGSRCGFQVLEQPQGDHLPPSEQYSIRFRDCG
jgi:pyruvate,orthophosphate dikinase